MMARTRTQSQDKKLSDGRTKTRDMRDDYDAFFAIYSEKEVKFKPRREGTPKSGVMKS